MKLDRNKRKQLKQRTRREIYESLGGHCAYCGCELQYKDMQLDHMVPLHVGGADELSNMLPACRSCNHYKATLTVEKFRSAIERFPAVLMRDSVTFRNAVRFGIVEIKQEPTRFYFEQNPSAKE